MTAARIPALPRVFDTLDDAVRELPKGTRVVGTIAASHFAFNRAAMARLASVLEHELAVVPCNHGRQLTVFVAPLMKPAANSTTPNAPAPAGEEVSA